MAWINFPISAGDFIKIDQINELIEAVNERMVFYNYNSANNIALLVKEDYDDTFIIGGVGGVIDNKLDEILTALNSLGGKYWDYGTNSIVGTSGLSNLTPASNIYLAYMNELNSYYTFIDTKLKYPIYSTVSDANWRSFRVDIDVNENVQTTHAGYPPSTWKPCSDPTDTGYTAYPENFTEVYAEAQSQLSDIANWSVGGRSGLYGYAYQSLSHDFQIGGSASENIGKNTGDTRAKAREGVILNIPYNTSYVGTLNVLSCKYYLEQTTLSRSVTGDTDLTDETDLSAVINVEVTASPKSDTMSIAGTSFTWSDDTDVYLTLSSGDINKSGNTYISSQADESTATLKYMSHYPTQSHSTWQTKSISCYVTAVPPETPEHESPIAQVGIWSVDLYATGAEYLILELEFDKRS